MKRVSPYRLPGILLGFIIIVFFLSCQKEDPLDGDETFVENVPEHLAFEENIEEGLPNRVSVFNRALVLKDTSLGRGAPGEPAIWVHVGDIASTTLNGKLLSATQVIFEDGKAYVSYHLQGPQYGGMIDVVDLSDPKKPKITCSTFFHQADVNAIAVEKDPNGSKRKIWLALSDEKKGGILAELEIKNAAFTQNYYRQVYLSEFLGNGISTASANGIVEAGEWLYVTSGRSNGGVFTIKKSSLSYAGRRDFPNAKAVTANGDENGASLAAALQAGDNARVYVSELGDASFKDEIALGMSIQHQKVDDPLSGKLSLCFDPGNPNLLHVAGGAQGILTFDLASKQQIFQSPSEMLPLGNCNAVHVDHEYFYAANGADGLCIFRLDGGGLPDQTKAFLWDLDEVGASANFVRTDGDWVFVAKGEGGVKILKRPRPGDLLPLCDFDAQGVPNCKFDEPVCTGLMQKVNATLPINKHQPTLHPQYFTGGASEITMQEEGKLLVSFLSENTNQKHVLGYYFYNEDSPPASPSDLVGLVVFPNFSALNSGGNLSAGNTVELPTVFKKGMKVGFFLVKKGWTGSALSTGQGSIYTNPAFNPNPNKQGLLLYDPACDIFVGAFEHNPMPSSNADFREAVFSVKVNPGTSVSVADYLQF